MNTRRNSKKILCKKIAIALAISLPHMAQAALDDTVLVWIESSEVNVGLGSDGVMEIADRGVICERVRGFINSHISGPLISFMNETEMDQNAVGAATDEAWVENCEQLDTEPSGNHWLIYTTCSMVMGSDTHWMRWTVPPLAAEAEMVVLDFAANQAIYTPLETSLEVLDGIGPRLDNYNVSGPSSQKNISIRVMDGPSVQRTFSARKFVYSYDASLASFGGGDIGMLAQLGKIETTGTSWIAEGVPGMDVINKFHENFKNHVQPAEGVGSMMAGVVEQMSELASHGLPLETETTTTMGGALSSFGGMLDQSMGSGTTSTSTVKSVAVSPATAYCGPTQLPEGMEIVSIEGIMAEATGAGAAGSGPAGAAQNPEVQDALRQAREALEQLTPDQRAAMDKFGLGSMIPGMNQPAVAPAAAPPSSSSMPSADSLYSDNMTQMAQNHLIALGYETGGNSGELTVDTMIAISEFQADNKMEVTGAVSPQLLGILSAEVDKRR